MLDINKLKLITLCENTAASTSFLGEWGLSVLVVVEDRYKLLFDTGLGQTLLYNADAFGIDLCGIEGVVLSHGHNDHTGGLKSLLRRVNSWQPENGLEIYCHPDAVNSKYVKHSQDTGYNYAGIPFRLEELENWGGRFKYSKEPVWLSENIVCSGEIPMTNSVETVTEICYLKNDTGFHSDPVLDDQALYITTNLGIIVILGCSHRGIINSVQYARQVTGMEKVYMVIGGTHLVKASQERLDFTISQLKAMGVEKIGVSHCTGMKSSAYLSNHFPDNAFIYNNAGTMITYDNGQLQTEVKIIKKKGA
jgi:7,8-dihydropterin-6-yl-methyl-4-(beta-D-ribofuranosyl)aminobenzene 5'-phosphate synthase